MRHAYITKRYAPEGYVAVTRLLAQHCYEAGYSVTMCGNNVNSAHIFGGWRLGYTANQYHTQEMTALDHDFSDLVNNFLSYLEKELGTYAVFYVRVPHAHAIARALRVKKETR